MKTKEELRTAIEGMKRSIKFNEMQIVEYEDKIRDLEVNPYCEFMGKKCNSPCQSRESHAMLCYKYRMLKAIDMIEQEIHNPEYEGYKTGDMLIKILKVLKGED